MRVTLRSVAEAAGVDPSTVSRVLNGATSHRVGEETRQRILEAARELDYRPNLIARSLRLQRTATLGMLIPDISNPFFARLIRGAEEVAISNGYTLLLSNTDDSLKRERAYLRLMQEKQVDGFLVSTHHLGDEFMAELFGAGYPIVLVNRRSQQEGQYSVIYDDFNGARLAIEHLIEQGYRRIAHISGPSYAATARDRQAGYVAAMRQAGLPTWLEKGSFLVEGGVQAMTTLLAKGSLAEAIFCVNDLSAIGALQVLHGARLKVPDDVALMGFNDLPMLEYLSPPLSSVHMPLHEMGRLACRMLLELLQGGTPDPPEVVFPAEVAIRASTDRSVSSHDRA